MELLENSNDFLQIKLEACKNIIKDNIIFTKIREISSYDVQNINVIDLKMQKCETPSYVTNSGIVHNGGGKRNGSFAIYLEPWHLDIEDFLDLKINHGDENARARDLFYGLWVPNLFMDRVEKDLDWTLFCPDRCPGLSDCYGQAFNNLYTSYEERNQQAIATDRPKLGKLVKARKIWNQIVTSQIETGSPYLLYKDACNEKSNQKNLGTIKSSNSVSYTHLTLPTKA